MKKTFIFVIAALATFTSCKKQTFEDRVAEEVEYFNKNEAPKRQDPISVFDSMTFERQTLTVGYYYTVEGIGEEQFPLELMKENVLKNIRASIQLKTHKEHKVNFRYVYLAKSNKKVLMDETYTAEDYK